MIIERNLLQRLIVGLDFLKQCIDETPEHPVNCPQDGTRPIYKTSQYRDATQALYDAYAIMDQAQQGTETQPDVSEACLLELLKRPKTQKAIIQILIDAHQASESNLAKLLSELN